MTRLVAVAVVLGFASPASADEPPPLDGQAREVDAFDQLPPPAAIPNPARIKRFEDERKQFRARFELANRIGQACRTATLPVMTGVPRLTLFITFRQLLHAP